MNILITGTSSGIGEALALHFSDNSEHCVVWIDRISRNAWWELLTADLSDTDSIQSVFPMNRVYDLVILNAWVWYFWGLEEVSIQENRTMISVNLLAHITLLSLLSTHGNLTKNAMVIAIGSQAGKHLYSWWAAYQATKWWLRWFIGSIRKEWKEKSIFLLHPNIVDTNFFRHTKTGTLPPHLPKTEKNDIIQCVDDIILWKIKQWEIDC